MILANSADVDFIEAYDNILPDEVCEQIIKKFKTSSDKKAGQTGAGIDRKKKFSEDITITGIAEWQELHQIILNHTFEGLKDYCRKYPFFLTGAVSPTVTHPKTSKPTTLNIDNFEELGEHFLPSLLPFMYRNGTINVQKYKKGKGGYPHWHSEIYPQDASCETLHRTLLFMFYLNDIERGGETEFFYQNKKLSPKKGTLVIAPAGFTHTHRGNIPESDDKYIITSWILFNRAENLYRKS